ncbi:MAG: hypothetical protein AB7V32_00750 [Candidatus Berkiella sp.]
MPLIMNNTYLISYFSGWKRPHFGSIYLYIANAQQQFPGKVYFIEGE